MFCPPQNRMTVGTPIARNRRSVAASGRWRRYLNAADDDQTAAPLAALAVLGTTIGIGIFVVGVLKAL
jgi:hypothetical protein